MKKMFAVIITLILLSFASVAFANDYEITYIKPIFSEATPLFGDFTIQVGIKSHVNKKTEIIVACLYVGVTRPGVYYKNEPQVTKQYKKVTIDALGEATVTFDKDFKSYHPKAKGELIISIVGTGVVRSYPLKTRFHPGSND